HSPDVPSACRLRAQLAFKDSMVHGILQFTPSIAFHYVLHRCESRDIRCRESFCFFREKRHPAIAPADGASRAGSLVHVPWRGSRRGSLFRREGERLPPVRGSARAPPDDGARAPRRRFNTFAGRSAVQVSTMILPQVHLRKPCYDFSFLYMIKVRWRLST